jgi:carbon monoxide dehydrogenase subunit G
MKSTLSVTCEQRIPATAAVVWDVVADPDMHERLDSRCRLVSATGDWRRAGSEFVLAVRGVRLRYVVAEADPGLRWVGKVDRGGNHAGVQCGEFDSNGTETLLRWTVSVATGPLTRRLVKRSCERELLRWLAAVEREALASVA